MKKIIPFRLNYRPKKKGFKKMKISLVRQKRGRHARREWKAEDQARLCRLKEQREDERAVRG